MSRPRIGRAIVRGLREILPMVAVEIEAGAEGYLQNSTLQERKDAAKALAYLYALADWHEARQKAEDKLREHE